VQRGNRSQQLRAGILILSNYRTRAKAYGIWIDTDTVVAGDFSDAASGATVYGFWLPVRKWTFGTSSTGYIATAS